MIMRSSRTLHPTPDEPGRSQLRITTLSALNLAFKQWGTIFPGAACVGALVDRFTENCHVLNIEGESWRQREGQASDRD